MDLQHKHLQNLLSLDLDKLIKNTKTREDNFLQLINLAGSIINERSQIESNIYIHDQIYKYRKLAIQIKSRETQLFLQGSEMSIRYRGIKIQSEDNQYLLRRVCNRILDTILNTINQINFKAPIVVQEYIKLKINCQKIMKESKDQSSQLMQCINEYENFKISKILDLIISITSILQSGNFNQLEQLQTQFEATKQNYEKQKIIENRSITFDFLKKNRNYVKERLNLLRNEAVALEKEKDSKVKTVKKITEGLRGVMEISKQGCIQELVGRQDLAQALFHGLLMRNKENSQLISQFVLKKHKFEHKTSEQLYIQEMKLPLSDNIMSSELISADNKESFFSARRSLFVKMKQNNYKQRTVNSELFRKINRQESNKIMLRRYSKLKQTNDKQFIIPNKQHSLLKSIQEVPTHEGIVLRDKDQNRKQNQNHLPALNQRTQSIDQHCKQSQPEAKLISRSTKLSQPMRKKNKFQKTEMYPIRIKMELNSEIVEEASMKFTKFKKHLCL